jgi:hypothetical protein
MHIIETYATNTGLRIDKPQILEKYYPLDFDRFVTLHTTSKPYKTYDHWQAVIELILPTLEEEDIHIIQIGGAQEKKIKGCSYHLLGSTSVNQCAYLINRSLVHVGCDSFSAHMAGAMDTKMVIIYPICNLNNVSPYWGDEINAELITPPNKSHRRPNYAFDETPKSINDIPPEKIARAICQKLDLNFDFPYETLRIGDSYHMRTIEAVTDRMVDPKDFGLDNLIVRNDIWPYEQGLVAQLEVCKCSIVTATPINLDIIKRYGSKILTVVYFIEEDDDPSFARFLEKSGLNYSLASRLPEEEVNEKKLNYINLENAAIIHSPRRDKNDIEEIKNEDIDKLYYMSANTILSRGKAYASKADVILDDPIENFGDVKKLKDHPAFWEYLENYLILKKLD